MTNYDRNYRNSWWWHQMEIFFPRYWPFVRSPVNSPHEGQWRGILMFSLIWAWKNGWVNSPDAGDLRRHRHSNYIGLHNGQRSCTWWIITVWRRDTSYHDFIRRKFASTVHGLIKIQKKILNNCPVLSTKVPGIQGMYNMYWPYKKNSFLRPKH